MLWTPPHYNRFESTDLVLREGFEMEMGGATISYRQELRAGKSSYLQTPHFILSTAHWKLHTMHCSMSTAHYILHTTHTTHNTQTTTNNTQHTIHNTQQTTYETQQSTRNTQQTTLQYTKHWDWVVYVWLDEQLFRGTKTKKLHCIPIARMI